MKTPKADLRELLDVLRGIDRSLQRIADNLDSVIERDETLQTPDGVPLEPSEHQND